MVCSYALLRLGDNASHIVEDGGAITDASSSHLWWKPSRIWWGGLLELVRAEKNGVSEMGLSDIFRFEAKASCAYT